MPNIDDEIRIVTAGFAGELAVLIRRLAFEAVSAALGTGKVATSVTSITPAKRGRPRKQVAVAAPEPEARREAKSPVSKKPAAKRPSGEKRPPAELAKLTEKLGEYIKAHPGLRMEALGKALGSPTRELNLPIKKLLAVKKVCTEGQRRATEYFPA